MHPGRQSSPDTQIMHKRPEQRVFLGALRRANPCPPPILPNLSKSFEDQRDRGALNGWTAEDMRRHRWKGRVECGEKHQWSLGNRAPHAIE